MKFNCTDGNGDIEIEADSTCEAVSNQPNNPMKTKEIATTLRIYVREVREVQADLECDMIDSEANVFSFGDDGFRPWECTEAMEALGFPNAGRADYGFEKGYSDHGRFWVTRWDVGDTIKDAAWVKFRHIDIFDVDDDGDLEWRTSRVEILDSWKLNQPNK